MKSIVIELIFLLDNVRNIIFCRVRMMEDYLLQGISDVFNYPEHKIVIGNEVLISNNIATLQRKYVMHITKEHSAFY